MEARYLTDADGDRVGVVLSVAQYAAVREAHGAVARASRALRAAEESVGEARVVFEARMAETEKALGKASRRLDAALGATAAGLQDDL